VYEEICNFALCPGDARGKYIVTKAAAYSGCDFMNYKGTLSIVLFSVEDATYKLLHVNAGCKFRLSDGGVFRSSDFQKLIEECSLNFP